MKSSLVFAAFLLGVVPMQALSVPLTVDAQVRWRAEHDNRAFDGTAVSHQFLRSRIGVGLESEEGGTRLFLQAQDSRRLGESASGSLENDRNLGIHQAYLQVDEFFSPQVAVKVGRFEINHGDQRLVGAVGWNNVGRTFDGVTVTGSWDEGSLEAFQAKRFDSAGVRPDRDLNLYGLYLRTDSKVDGFVYYDRNDTKTRGDNPERSLDRWTLGAHSKRPVGERADINGTVAFQTGSIGGADISAYLVALEAGAKPVEGKPHRVALGIDFASGDDKPSEGKVESFDNLYYTGHKFRGYMDQFVASSVFGLLDMYGKVQWVAPQSWVLNVHAHAFQSATSLNTVGGGDSKFLGFELDVVGTKKDLGRAKLDVGGSVFFPGEDWRGSDADTALWAFASLTVGFSSQPAR